MHADSSQWPVALVFTGNCLEVPAYLKEKPAHAKNWRRQSYHAVRDHGREQPAMRSRCLPTSGWAHM